MQASYMMTDTAQGLNPVLKNQELGLLNHRIFCLSCNRHLINLLLFIFTRWVGWHLTAGAI